MLGSFFDLRREVEAIAARRERNTPPQSDPAPALYEDFDHRIHAFLRSLNLGQAHDPSSEIKVQGTPFAPR